MGAKSENGLLMGNGAFPPYFVAKIVRSLCVLALYVIC